MKYWLTGYWVGYGLCAVLDGGYPHRREWMTVLLAIGVGRTLAYVAMHFTRPDADGAR